MHLPPSSRCHLFPRCCALASCMQACLFSHFMKLRASLLLMHAVFIVYYCVLMHAVKVYHARLLHGRKFHIQSSHHLAASSRRGVQLAWHDCDTPAQTGAIVTQTGKSRPMHHESCEVLLRLLHHVNKTKCSVTTELNLGLADLGRPRVCQRCLEEWRSGALHCRRPL